MHSCMGAMHGNVWRGCRGCRALNAKEAPWGFSCHEQVRCLVQCLGRRAGGTNSKMLADASGFYAICAGGLWEGGSQCVGHTYGMGRGT